MSHEITEEIPQEISQNSSALSMPKAASPRFLLPQRKTKLWVWFVAGLVFLFALFLIFGSLAFLVIRPKFPIFNIQSSNSSNLNELLVNLSFENPNKRIKVSFQTSSTQLLYNNNLVARKFIYPFNLSTQETKFGSVRFASDFRSLHEIDKMDLQKQLQNNKLELHILAIFRVRATLGYLHYSITLLGRCEIQLGSPPNEVLLTHHCTMKKKN